ncbi:hypothetical protein PR202_gb08326 [Eleusine coracana subsp. coracana]|uniref:Flavin-containing monooxygenase n=1 Tax=Eleusine coracana subsp. coracana TaxID=191504 RepID=A0AAV5EEC5_ELECO|nr:hypothetical protein QOZ80_2BG0183820 [Eleusine coracana subsp. coracana]GJN20892.1 hypothetical protein PR202_gb08326 [Eleusine coracana subsp. coracana]
METVSDDVPPATESKREKKKVCVVGAGMAGLTAARELRREGHAVTVMEQSGDVGGQWLYDPRTDAGDPAAPVRVHSSMYASVRLLSPRECMGVSDFQFLPKHGVPGRDPRRFPGHREVFFYLKDFCHEFGIMEMVRLNTKVVRVAMASEVAARWQVRSVRVDPESGEEDEEEEEEVFDAVVVANGHYSQPRLPTITGMGEWRRRQMHSHSYRVPDTFRGQAVVLVGSGDSAMDIALDLICGSAKSVHISANTPVVDEKIMTPAMRKMLANHADLHLHQQIHRLHEDGTVAFADGTSIMADCIIYCTGYRYSFPFLDTGGAVAVDEDGWRVGPLFEHTFPPALAPGLSFVGVQKKLFVPWFFEAQGRWIARVLSGRTKLPPVEEMMTAVEQYRRDREVAGVPAKYAHDIGGVNPSETYEFWDKYSELPRREEWKRELTRAVLRDINDDRETFRDLDNDSDSVREGLQTWLGLSSDDALHQAAGAYAQV